MTLTATLAFLGALLIGAMALGTVLQPRRSLAHWSFAAGLLVLAVESVFLGLSADTLIPEEIRHWQKWRCLAKAFLPGIWLFFSLTYARGDARQSLARWRVPLLFAFVVPIALVLVFPSRLIEEVLSNDGKDWLIGLDLPGLLLNGAFLLCSILILMNLESTFRASVGTMRWRIKFMILGLAMLFAVRAYTSSQVLVFRQMSLSLQTLNAAALLVAALLMLRSLLRAGHFEVSVYPSQAVLHNSLTVLLAGVYLLIVGVLARLLKELQRTSSFEAKAFLILLALLLLTVLLLSERVRLYTKRFISRNFQRPLYDYRTVWRTFTEGTARQVEKNKLCSALVKLVSEIFQTLSVTIWLIDERQQRLTFGASTSLSQCHGEKLDLPTADHGEVIRALNAHPDPVDIDASRELWAATLRQLQPDEFRKGGNRLCVPMLAGGEFLGLIMLGDRVGGIPFSVQDFDLLKSVAEQAAASLLNIQLSQRLSQAKQLEAFQAMSAFFVHDLKNTASTLSLMLKNFPVHYQDPQFREDALRGIAKTVMHINDLIGRLSLLRQELTINPVECDLNEVIEEALKGQTEPGDIQFFKELGSLPKVKLDPGQIQKVLTNLVLNAREAVGPGGQIHIQTTRRNGWAVMAVADNGCGMSPEFIQSSLFRPFQTTKNKGIGIGMFHCKMIVEAHRGRIEVESEVGKGTAFRVLLPLMGPT